MQLAANRNCPVMTNKCISRHFLVLFFENINILIHVAIVGLRENIELSGICILLVGKNFYLFIYILFINCINYI